MTAPKKTIPWLLKFGPDANFPRLKRWLGTNCQGMLPLEDRSVH